jgi:ADP-dependent NAD(P)H-hydrate dehydratase / NAD(P)H-hydrate epimerase
MAAPCPLELLTVAQMRRADRLTVESGTPGIALMENAGRAVFEAAVRTQEFRGPVLIVCGTGNNGGDGLVAARCFAANGYRVDVVLVGDPSKLRGDAATALERWGGRLTAMEMVAPASYGLIVDAIFGAGLDREISGIHAAWIDGINRAGSPVVSVDLPSGVDGDNGRIMGRAVRADLTVTFYRKKPGHLLMPGKLCCGETHLAEIGIRDELLGEIAPATSENAPPLWRNVLPRPQPDSHKYRRGYAVVVSGGRSHTGAARLAAEAALVIGAGIVSLASPAEAIAVNACHLTAVMLAEADDDATLASLLRDTRVTAVAIGPGAGTGLSTCRKVETALASGAPCVLDADALNSFEQAPGKFFAMIGTGTRDCVLTPHEGEFSRLFGELAGGEAKLRRAREAARRSGATVILKGGDSVIAAPDGRAAINANAPGWLATAGSGDVLTGMICGLMAQRMRGFEAACAATWMHGEAAHEFGPGLTAERLAERLPDMLSKLIRR